MKLTYGKSEPWKSGWKGWADSVEVYLDGRHIGYLVAEDCQHKRYMAYDFTNKVGIEKPRSDISVNLHSPYGLRAAKGKLAAELSKIFNQKRETAC